MKYKKEKKYFTADTAQVQSMQSGIAFANIVFKVFFLSFIWQNLPPEQNFLQHQLTTLAARLKI